MYTMRAEQFEPYTPRQSSAGYAPVEAFTG
jgi:hypothetical protein